MMYDKTCDIFYIQPCGEMIGSMKWNKIMIITNDFSFTNESWLSLSLILRPTVNRPVCLGIKHPSGAYDQIFITVRQLWVCWCGALWQEDGSLVYNCCWSLPAVIFGSESRETRNRILVFQIRYVPFRCLVWLAGLWWRYSTPPLHRSDSPWRTTTCPTL
jgi:hypothetical protein